MKLPKIYYVANAKMPTDKAHGIQLIKMCEAFLRHGADVELILPGRKATRVSEIKNFYGVDRIPARTVFVPDLHNFGRAGFLVSSFFFGLSYFLYLTAKKIKGENFMVYTADLDHFSFLPMAFLRVPYFTEIHGEKKKTFLHKLFFRRASGIIAINKFMKENLINNFGLPPEKIDVRPNGIDLEKFNANTTQESARKKLSLPGDVRLVLYVGRLYDWKGFETLFSAAKALQKGTQIYFIGGTDEEARQFAGDRKIPENIIFAGVKSYKEIPLWLAASHALLLLGTSKNTASYYYTSPMKLFEYMASNRPIIASATPANKAVVGDAEVFFYEPDDWSGLAANIHKIFDDPEKAMEKAARALKKSAEFSWKKRGSAILNFIGNNIE